jgi:Mce-associated membrane protein
VSPTWYDLLGVEPGASAAEIRAAWKAAITDLEPGDRRFRRLNEAAEVLLDPGRRAAYDATLEPDPEPEPEPVELIKSDQEAEPVPEAEPVEDLVADEPADKVGEPARPRRTVPGWLLAGLAVLTALMLAAVGYLLAQPSDDSIAKATTQAQSAAEKATPVILAYDFRTLDKDQKASDALLTSAYRKEYDKLFAAIRENADTVKPVVTAKVVASGIIRADADRVQVLVLVDRTTVNAQASQTVSNDQVRVTMERDGDDWLVDKMDTQPLPS